MNQDVATTMYNKLRSSHRKHMCMLEAKSFSHMSRVAVWSEAVPLEKLRHNVVAINLF